MNSLEMNAILPIGILIVSGIACMLIGSGNKQTAKVWCSTISLLGLAAAAVTISRQQDNAIVYSGSLSLDPFGRYFQLLFLVVMALVCLGSREYLSREAIPAGEYYALLHFATSGMFLMAAANDLMVVFIGLEISSLASYILIGLRRTVPASSESSLKYFLLGSFATAFFLYGVALLFGVTGSTQISTIRTFLYGGQNAVPASLSPASAAEIVHTQFGFAGSMDLLLGAAIALLFVGLAFKVSAAPFQAWTPDAYQGAASPVVAMLSTAPKAAAFAAFLRIFVISLGASAVLWSNVVWLVAVLTMSLGNFAALRQTNIKRLLAYSSIAHAGYILVAFTASSLDASAAILFYLAAYSFMNVGAFILVGYIAGPREQRTTLDDYAGLAYRAPGASACLTILLLSLVGIPLTAGFLGKFYVFRAALQSGYVWLTVLGALNSAVAAYYYLRILVSMYMKLPADNLPDTVPIPRGAQTVAVICTFATLLIGVYPQLVMRLAESAAQWLPPL